MGKLWDLKVQSGPSPRGWGEHAEEAGEGAGGRTIPTRVGRTSVRLLAAAPEPDHPHAGGENGAQVYYTLDGTGPSPRGWGEQLADELPAQVLRTIPTRVGRTPPAPPPRLPRPDHPHAGGENYSPANEFTTYFGPSPRGWGEHVKLCARLINARTIPTRVGRTVRVDRQPHNYTDHPHAGGENYAAHMSKSSLVGPSPRGWGEPHGPGLPSPRARTIPTRVGRTIAKRPGNNLPADHPHAGGENLSRAVFWALMDGPSPRGWGEPTRSIGFVCGRRTIPTRVGRTASGFATRSATADHPHAGGENDVRPFTVVRIHGPSPRGWGERPIQAGHVRL